MPLHAAVEQCQQAQGAHIHMRFLTYFAHRDAAGGIVGVRPAAGRRPQPVGLLLDKQQTAARVKDDCAHVNLGRGIAVLHLPVRKHCIGLDRPARGHDFGGHAHEVRIALAIVLVI